MTRAERETVIVANLADLDEGWFSVETTEEGAFNRLKKLCGDKLQVTEHRSSLTGRITTWECRVPAEFWGGSTLRVRKARKGTPQGTENLRKAQQKRLTERKQASQVAGSPDTPVNPSQAQQK